MGVLDVLLPELATFLSDQPEEGGLIWRMLGRVDEMTRERGEPLSDLVLCSALLLEPMIEYCENARDRMRTAGEFLEPLIDRLNVPRRIADAMRRIVALLPRLESGRGGRFQRTALYVDASIVQGIRRDARMVEQIVETDKRDDTPAESLAPARPKRRRRGRPAAATDTAPEAD
jgi:poly(A) polymerase